MKNNSKGIIYSFFLLAFTIAELVLPWYYVRIKTISKCIQSQLIGWNTVYCYDDGSLLCKCPSENWNWRDLDMTSDQQENIFDATMALVIVSCICAAFIFLIYLMRTISTFKKMNGLSLLNFFFSIIGLLATLVAVLVFVIGVPKAANDDYNFGGIFPYQCTRFFGSWDESAFKYYCGGLGWIFGVFMLVFWIYAFVKARHMAKKKGYKHIK